MYSEGTADIIPATLNIYQRPGSDPELGNCESNLEFRTEAVASRQPQSGGLCSVHIQIIDFNVLHAVEEKVFLMFLPLLVVSIETVTFEL